MLFEFLLCFSLSYSSCDVLTGQSFDGSGVDYRSISNKCYIITDCIFANTQTSTSGGAIAISGIDTYAIVHDCVFDKCTTKTQGGCIYFSGNRIETFRCCVLNCSARYSSAFLISEISVLASDDGLTSVDMVSCSNCVMNMNAVSSSNLDAKISNMNVTRCMATMVSVGFEFVNPRHSKAQFFDFSYNDGKAEDNAMIYVHTSFTSDENCIINYGNIVGNTASKGGYIFNFIYPVTVSNVICMKNPRKIISAIRFTVLFDSCVFDLAESLTDVAEETNCRFNTHTSTYQITLLDDCGVTAKQFLSRIWKENSENNMAWIIVGVCLTVLSVFAIIGIVLYTRYKQNNSKEYDNYLSIQ